MIIQNDIPTYIGAVAIILLFGYMAYRISQPDPYIKELLAKK
jgi:hypothetical protein